MFTSLKMLALAWNIAEDFQITILYIYTHIYLLIFIFYWFIYLCHHANFMNRPVKMGWSSLPRVLARRLARQFSIFFFDVYHRKCACTCAFDSGRHSSRVDLQRCVHRVPPLAAGVCFVCRALWAETPRLLTILVHGVNSLVWSKHNICVAAILAQVRRSSFKPSPWPWVMGKMERRKEAATQKVELLIGWRNVVKNKPGANSERIVEAWEISPRATRVTRATRAKVAGKNRVQVTGNVQVAAATTSPGGLSASNVAPANQQKEVLVEAKVAIGTLVLVLVADDEMALPNYGVHQQFWVQTEGLQGHWCASLCNVGIEN